jgi:hypothetical protein
MRCKALANAGQQLGFANERRSFFGVPPSLEKGTLKLNLFWSETDRSSEPLTRR